MITANVIQRVFLVKFGVEQGTCFSIDEDERQYIITANHLIKQWDFNKELEIFHENKWKILKFDLVGQAEDSDIAVLAAPCRLSPSFSLPADSARVTYGQDVYFLGFPYGISTDLGSINNGFPFPLVKKGIVSSMFPKNQNYCFFLDGHNNPGFSGGPVVLRKSGEESFSVVAVISGYQWFPEPIYLDNEKTPLSYRANTGIIISHGIEAALELIRKNPIGFPILNSQVTIKN